MLRSPGRGSTLRVFVLAFVVFAYFMPQWADWNIDSRVDLVHAIVDQHRLAIDTYAANTWDKAVFHHHFYSDKAPGTAALGASVYGAFLLARHAPGLGSGISAIEASGGWNAAIRIGKSATQNSPAPTNWNLGGCQRTGVAGNVQYIPWGNRLYRPMRQWAFSKYLMTVGVVGLLSALFAAFFFWILGLFGLGLVARWLSTALYAFGSVALPYSTNFYSHQLAAAFLFTAFGLIYLYSRRKRFWLLPAAGFLLGFALFTEYTVAIIAVVLGVYALWVVRSNVRGLVSLGVAGAVPLIGLMVYNAASFGNPLDTGYSHDFCWSAAQAGGFAGFTYPHANALFDLTLGPYRGLFFTSPFLLLAVPGIVVLWRSGWKPEAYTVAAAAGIFILAISAYWGWNGGRVDGPRYLVPAVPFLAFPAAFAVQFGWSRLWSRVLILVLSGLSLAATWALFLGGDQFPASWFRDPLVKYSLPALRHNDVTSNLGFFLGLRGWTSLLPLAALVVIVLVLPSRTRPEPARRTVPLQKESVRV